MIGTTLHGIIGLVVWGCLSWVGPAYADIVLDSNVIKLNTTGGQNPFAQARFAAITQVAVFTDFSAL